MGRHLGGIAARLRLIRTGEILVVNGGAEA